MKTAPYDTMNALGDSVCSTGMRKPAYGASINQMDPQPWRTIWTEYVAFLENPDTGNSTVIAQCFSISKAKSIPSVLTSYPFCAVKNHAMVVPWYLDASLDETANIFGARIRDLLRSTDNLVYNSSYISTLLRVVLPFNALRYINLAHGDEPLETVYGNNVLGLQILKRLYDPYKRFSQWFPLSRTLPRYIRWCGTDTYLTLRRTKNYGFARDIAR